MKLLVVGLVVLGLAAVLFVVSVVGTIASTGDVDVLCRWVGPGESLLHVEEEGRYWIYSDHMIRFQGRDFDAPERLPPDCLVDLRDAEGREQWIDGSSGYSSRSTAGGRTTACTSIGEVRLAPGDYVVRAVGDFEPRVFSVGSPAVGADTLAAGLGMLLAVPVALLGVLLSIVGFALWLARRPSPGPSRDSFAPPGVGPPPPPPR